MAIAKMTLAELENFLRVEFPQSFGSGDTAIESADGETCLLRQRYSDRMLRPGRTISGPTLMGLADCAMYVVLLSAIGPVGLAVTTNLNINFLRRGPPGQDILAAARIWKLAGGRGGQPAGGNVPRPDRPRDVDLFHSKYLVFSEVISHHNCRLLI